jgi:hypothetical protein
MVQFLKIFIVFHQGVHGISQRIKKTLNGKAPGCLIRFWQDTGMDPGSQTGAVSFHKLEKFICILRMQGSDRNLVVYGQSEHGI